MNQSPGNPPRRVRRAMNHWTLREHEMVVTYWPDRATIRGLLPHRSSAAIDNFAGKCNLRKAVHHWTAAEDAALRKALKNNVPRKEIERQLGLTKIRLPIECSTWASDAAEGSRCPRASI